MMNRIAFTLLTLFLPLSIANASGTDHGHMDHDHGHPVLPSAPYTASKDSLYVMDAKFTDTDGRTLSLGELRGKPVLISMFYGTCPKACPLLISDLKRIEAKVGEAKRKDLQVVLVSFDPERDTVESLSKLRAAHGVDEDRWVMLRTDPETVEELAAILGIRYRFAKDGSIHHSTVITLLDREGVMVERIEGLRQPSDDVVAKVEGM